VGTKRFRIVAALVVALYALVAETSELRHHDLACSPKASGSPCEICARGPEVTRVETGFRLDQPTLVELGDVHTRTVEAPRTGRSLPRIGRAPPA
jgi:hypothetical protein